MKKYYILLLILFSSLNCYASFWDSIGECISDPCNCGHGHRHESWHGKNIDKGKENSNCPPWNKNDGRRDHTCIVQFPYPKPFTMFYLKHCGEKTKESSYFDPKIRIRNQSCNAFACWSFSTTLNWDGECVVWPTPWGIPLLRICARIALPADSVRNIPADPGYTLGKHLDYEGYEARDEVIYGVDGQPIIFDRPKLCAYRDPSLFDIISVSGGNLDPMDFNPKKQIFHKTTELHPIAKVLIFLIDMGAETGQSLTSMLDKLFDKLNSDPIPGLNIFKDIFDAIGKIIDYVKDAFAALIKRLGQLNNAVDSYHFGCVNIPMGPFPPPYCPKLAPFVPTPTTQVICEIGADGLPLKSTSDNKCVVSKLINNSIRNTIRVTFDNFVPICRNGENPQLTDKCVVLSNIGPFNSAKAMHIATANRDSIKPCSSSQAGGTPCTNTKIPFTCSVSNNGCEDGFRVVYATKTGSLSTPSGYFLNDLPDCDSSVTTNCQEVWGINIGEFTDITLAFPEIQTISDIGPLVQNFSLNDINGTTRSLYASIVRQPTSRSDIEFQQEPDQICAFESENIVGCVRRAKIPKPVLYSCDSNISGLSCKNDYFTPRFIAKIRDGNDSSSIIVEPLSVNSPNKSSYEVNIAGVNFTSFITDETYITKPFSGPKSFNPASIYGNYINNLAPYDSSGRATNAIYLTGLEYVNDNYIDGGKYACLQFRDLEHCPINTVNCVLTNLLDRDIVNCKDFADKLQIYPELRLCTSKNANCKRVDSIEGKNGGSGVIINRCKNDYCYTNSRNMEVCSISHNPKDRYLPSSTLGNTLSDSQYYNIHDAAAPGLNYDKNLYTLRDKTSIEFNLCISIPQPKCPAITTPTERDGNATWPEAEIGQEIEGTCSPGMILINPLKPLKRYCLANAENRTVSFEVLGKDIGCMLPAIKLKK